VGFELVGGQQEGEGGFVVLVGCGWVVFEVLVQFMCLTDIGEEVGVFQVADFVHGFDDEVLEAYSEHSELCLDSGVEMRSRFQELGDEGAAFDVPIDGLFNEFFVEMVVGCVWMVMSISAILLGGGRYYFLSRGDFVGMGL
jgi:hypothetical protein